MVYWLYDGILQLHDGYIRLNRYFGARPTGASVFVVFRPASFFPSSIPSVATAAHAVLVRTRIAGTTRMQMCPQKTHIASMPRIPSRHAMCFVVLEFGSVGIVAAQERHDHDLDIEQKVPVFEIEQISPDAFP